MCGTAVPYNQRILKHNFLNTHKKETKKKNIPKWGSPLSIINLNIHIAYIFWMHLCKISQWLSPDIYPIHTWDTQNYFHFQNWYCTSFERTEWWWGQTRQYTQDTGTHCGVEVARSMASSTPFTLSSTSLLTRTMSKKCPYVDKMASDSFWIICRFSVWGKMVS